MRAYVVVTGCLFALIMLAHIARLFAEGAALLLNPMFLVATLAPLCMTIWAIAMLRKLPVQRMSG